MGKLADLTDKAFFSKDEVSKILKISLDEITEFEREGVVQCDPSTKSFDRSNFEKLKTAASLKRDLGVNVPGIDIILSMRERIDQLQTEFEDLLTSVQDRLGDEIVRDLREIEANIKNRK